MPPVDVFVDLVNRPHHRRTLTMFYIFPSFSASLFFVRGRHCATKPTSLEAKQNGHTDYRPRSA